MRTKAFVIIPLPSMVFFTRPSRNRNVTVQLQPSQRRESEYHARFLKLEDYVPLSPGVVQPSVIFVLPRRSVPHKARAGVCCRNRMLFASMWHHALSGLSFISKEKQLSLL
jgi:hypothetical protein